MAHQRSIPELIKTVKVLHEKAEQAAGKAEQFYVTLGLTLNELKLKHKADTRPATVKMTWAALVTKHFPFKSRRADELILIANGTTSVETVRKQKRVSVKKARKKSKRALRSAQTKKDKTGCDYNPEDPEDVAEAGDTPEMIRNQIFKNRIGEVLRHARETPFKEAADSEITKEIVSLATQAAEAWSDIVTNLTRRQKRGFNGKGQQAHRQLAQ